MIPDRCPSTSFRKERKLASVSEFTIPICPHPRLVDGSNLGILNQENGVNLALRIFIVLTQDLKPFPRQIYHVSEVGFCFFFFYLFLGRYAYRESLQNFRDGIRMKSHQTTETPRGCYN